MTPEELRMMAVLFRGEGRFSIEQRCHRAADTIERLQGENATLQKQVAELERQVAKLREDSERYNFIRDQTVVDDAKFVGLMCNVSPDTMSIAFAWDKEQSLDAAIDAALKGDEP